MPFRYIIWPLGLHEVRSCRLSVTSSLDQSAGSGKRFYVCPPQHMFVDTRTLSLHDSPIKELQSWTTACFCDHFSIPKGWGTKSNSDQRLFGCGMGGGTGGGGGGGGGGTGPPQTFQRLTLCLSILSMGGAWKESTSNGPRPGVPQSSRRGAALGLWQNS